MDLPYKNEKKLLFTAIVISSIFWLVLVVGTVGVAILYLLFMYVFFVFVHSGFISYLKGTGVRISEDQYPDLYKRLVNSCEKIGLDEIPEAYLLRTDFFNALATRFLGKNYIVLFTDVVDALEDHQGAIDFYIGHELGHIHRKHLLRGWFIAPASILPLLGAGLRRAEEYTCDRYGAFCCENEDDIKVAISAIAAGDTRWKNFNVDAYLNQVEETSGFWMSINELLSDYPWLTKRMAAALAAKRDQKIKQPSRNFLAWILAFFVPRLGVGGGATSIIIVIAIIGILASVAIPQYQSYIDRASYNQALSAASELKEPVANYALSTRSWPLTLEDIGIKSESFNDDLNAYSINLYEDGVIAANVGLDNAGSEQYILLEPSVIEGSIEWVCKSENIKTTSLPSGCI